MVEVKVLVVLVPPPLAIEGEDPEMDTLFPSLEMDPADPSNDDEAPIRMAILEEPTDSPGDSSAV